MAAPTVTSTAPTFALTTTITATAGGNVTADGGSAILGRGVVWSTSANPITSLATKTVDAGTTGAYTSSITGLTPNTTYYFRAYAVNADGTSYGAETTFQTRLIAQASNIVAAEAQPTRVVTYSTEIPFHRSMTICQYYMESDDALAPLNPYKYGSAYFPQPGFGAMYRLIADGSHTPTFSSEFKKSGASGDWVIDAHTLNLVSFIYDGVDYWYTIIQPA